jgi:hypothetical protein
MRSKTLPRLFIVSLFIVTTLLFVRTPNRKLDRRLTCISQSCSLTLSSHKSLGGRVLSPVLGAKDRRPHFEECT